MTLLFNREKIYDFRTVMEYVTILLTVLVSGSEYFMNFHMKETVIVLFVNAFILLILNKSKVNLKKLCWGLGFIGASVLLTFINVRYGVATNDVMLFIIKMGIAIIISSCIKIENFKEKYIYILVGISILSLICFIALLLGATGLPFAKQLNRSGMRDVWCSFYYTIGWKGTFFERNAGPFWEPGAFQIFINIALFFIITRENFKIDAKFMILSVTLFSTLSTTGYICFALNCILVLISSKQIRHKWQYFAIAIVLVVAMLIVNQYTGVLSDKLIERGGSFSTREKDTLVGFQMALERPLVGYGPFNNSVPTILRQRGVINISNGLAGYLIYNGFIYVGIYMALLTIFIDKVCKKNRLMTIVTLGIFILFFMSEFIMPMTLLFCFLMYSFDEYEVVDGFNNKAVTKTNDIIDKFRWR